MARRPRLSNFSIHALLFHSCVSRREIRRPHLRRHSDRSRHTRKDYPIYLNKPKQLVKSGDLQGGVIKQQFCRCLHVARHITTFIPANSHSADHDDKEPTGSSGSSRPASTGILRRRSPWSRGDGRLTSPLSPLRTDQTARVWSKPGRGAEGHSSRPAAGAASPPSRSWHRGLSRYPFRWDDDTAHLPEHETLALHRSPSE